MFDVQSKIKKMYLQDFQRVQCVKSDGISACTQSESGMVFASGECHLRTFWLHLLVFPVCSTFMNVFLFCGRKCIRKTQVEAAPGAKITECREGAHGQMPNDLGRDKGVALPGTPCGMVHCKTKQSGCYQWPETLFKMIETWELSGV